MRAKDISTAIQGHLWVVEHVNNPHKCVESIFALEDLRSQISNDKRLNAGPLMMQINRAMDTVQRRLEVQYTVHEEENQGRTESTCVAISLWALGLTVVGLYTAGLVALLG